VTHRWLADPVWEGITFAAMDQFKELWDGDMKGGLPVIINIMNNRTDGRPDLWRDHGFTASQPVSCRCERGTDARRTRGRYNPLAVIDALQTQAKNN